MFGGWTLGPVSPDDVHTLDLILIAAARAGWKDFIPEETLARMEPAEERWRAKWQGGATGTVAATAAGPIGFAVVCPSPDRDATPEVGQLDMLYVHPAWWGRGVGRALLGDAVARLAAADFTSATLWTAEGNTRPRAIYERAGWSADRVTRRNGFLGSELVELRYRRELGGRSAS